MTLAWLYVFKLSVLAFGAMFIEITFNLGWEFQLGIFLVGWAIMPEMVKVK